MSILELGAEMSFLGTAHGRCIMSTWPDVEIERLIGVRPLADFRPRLEVIRSRGHLDFALGEILPGIGAIAAPIVGEDGRAVASLAVSGEGLESELDVDSEVSSHVLRTARLISSVFTGRGG
jgi:DNA-binding IclR family transcriptional regulator